MSRGRPIPLLPFLLLAACQATRQGPPGGSEGRAVRGPETSPEEVRRLEAPLEIGLELVAATLEVELSPNYIQDETLVVPAGAGELQAAVRRPHGHAWQVQSGAGLIPLDFRLRHFRAKVVDRLVVDFPPVPRFTIRLRARGGVLLVLAGRELRGRELLVDEGRLWLDGRPLDPAAPPPGGGP